MPGIILVSLAAVFSALGFWQLNRAEQHRELEDRFERAADAPVLELPVAAVDIGSQRYSWLRLRGQYRARRQILLDNMTHAGQAGYQVLTPFDIGDGRLVLINRGWVPADPDRSRMPDVALANQHADISGRIDQLPRAALSLEAEPVSVDDALWVVSFPTIENIENLLGRQVYPFQVLLDPEADAGFVRDWQPGGVTPERNIAYAVQWFALAALAGVIAVVTGVRWLRCQRRAQA